ncbi:MAG TPA: integrase arm-type DNA-binding domain-containing protein [Vicinamibacterales bacterium]|nr:integrase arm-type DNA-binding domain-containing protein [Vicinamibacterales bacterium]
MPTVTLTDRFIDTLKAPPRRVEYHDGHCRGLVLRVTPAGVKTWTLRYRAENGSTQRLTLGVYPDLTLKGARKEADIQRGTVADGDDPAAAKRVARTMAQSATDTVADLAKRYLAKHAKTKKRSWQEDERMLNADVLPRWGTRRVADLTRRDVRALLEAIVDRGAPVAANRYLALVRKMLNFAVKDDWIDANPAALIDKPGAEASRERVLTDAELRLVWAGCATERAALCALTRLRIVTLQRGKELSHLRWEDIEGDWLTLPSTITKNKIAHRVFLTAPAQAILDTLPRISDCPWVFPGVGDRKPLGDEKKAGPRIREWCLAHLQKTDPSIETFDFRLHDLRRTGSTRMAEAGIPAIDVARVLNHIDGTPRATHVYNRYSYDREKQVALETWARVLTAILDEQPRPAVVPFARA